jgi:hypothetical protein
MKKSVAITLIICGTILIALPYLHNTIATKQVADAITALNKTVNLTADLPKYADALCMICGSLMILAGAIAGLTSSGKGDE